jgi:hypothetical protein
MSTYERYRRQQRRREMRAAAVRWAFLIIGGSFLAFVGWCAIVGMVALFG